MQSSKYWLSECSENSLSIEKHKGRNEGYTKWNKEKSTENSGKDEAKNQVNNLEQKEEISIHPE